MKLKVITDKDLIVFLITKGFDIQKIERDKLKNRSLVYFQKTDDLQRAIISFVNKKETVNINEYQAAEKRVKTLLYAQKS